MQKEIQSLNQYVGKFGLKDNQHLTQGCCSFHLVASELFIHYYSLKKKIQFISNRFWLKEAATPESECV